nr:Protein IQ-DOMAIN 32 [Triticum aestivum]
MILVLLQFVGLFLRGSRVAEVFHIIRDVIFSDASVDFPAPTPLGSSALSSVFGWLFAALIAIFSSGAIAVLPIGAVALIGGIHHIDVMISLESTFGMMVGGASPFRVDSWCSDAKDAQGLKLDPRQEERVRPGLTPDLWTQRSYPGLKQDPRGEAVLLVEMTGRVGVQNDAAEREKLAGDKDVPGVDAIFDDQASHRSFDDLTAELPMKAPMSVSKPADLGALEEIMIEIQATVHQFDKCSFIFEGRS